MWLDTFTVHVFEVHLRHSTYHYYVGIILYMASFFIFHCMDYHILFTHLPIDGHLICLLLLDSVNSAAMNIHIYQYLFEYLFSILGEYINFLLELLGHMVLLCLTFWHCPVVFWSGCTILYAHQQSLRVLNSSHTHPHLLLPVILIIAILLGVK